MNVSNCEVADPPPAPSTEPLRQLPATAEDQIRFRVRRLVETFSLNRHDREDLAQEAYLRLKVAMRGHDPAEASVGHFAKIVLNYWMIDRARRLRRDRLRTARRVLTGTKPAAEPSSMDELLEDVRLFRAFVADTAPTLSPVLDLLGTRTVRDIAKALGIDRVTVHRRIRRLQSIGRSWAALTGRPSGWHLDGHKF